MVYTDALQALVLLIGTGILTGVALGEVGGMAGLRESLDPHMLDMIRPADDPEMPWTGLVFGVPVLGIWYWCTDQVIVQRVLGAKDIHSARVGTLFAAVLKIFPVFLFVLPGLCARVLFPDIEPIAAFPTLITELMPIGLRGLVCAGLIAALMSSLDSTINSTGTLVSLDFYEHLRPQATQAQVIWVGRVTTVVVMVFGMLWVLVVERAESTFQYLQQVNAALSPPIAAAFLAGVFFKRAHHTGVMAALLGGFTLGVGLLVLDVIPFLISAGVTFVASLAILVVVSLLTTPAEDRSVGLTWFDSKRAPETRVTATERQSFFLAAFVIAFVMFCLWVAFAGRGH